MKYFLDTEFHEYKKDKLTDTIELISIGIVAEDGRELYRISDQFAINPACANEWLMANVIQPLCVTIDPETEWNGRSHQDANIVYDVIAQNRTKSDLVKSNYNIRRDIIEFIGNDKNPQFYAYYADYDWVVFCWLFGQMIDLPKSFPMYCRDLKQTFDEVFEDVNHDEIKALPSYPKQDNEHSALDDARWNKRLYDFLQSVTQ